MGSKYAGLRLAVMAVCFLAGFLFSPLFLIPAAILAWSLTGTPEEFHEAQRPKPKFSSIRRVRVAAEESDWKARYFACCESPAESSFLSAMIGSFSLQPQLGMLTGSGLTLDMQVGMGPYRLDFLANGWLVIEIDGAAYHSSPAAVARDKARDAYLQSYDYTVLRIPAKVVFSTPAQATAKVRSALAEGRRVASQPDSKQQAAAQKPASVRMVLGDLLKATGKFVDDISVHMEQSRAFDEAMAKPKAIFEAEKTAIQSALKCADSEIEVENFLAAHSPEYRELYNECFVDIGSNMKEGRDGHDPMEELRQVMCEYIVPIETPSPHPNPEIDENIKRAYRLLLEERSEYFEKIRWQTKCNERLRKLVKAHLEEMGCSKCWDAIA
jgi:very-short-patch-repair endonuclease